MKIGQRGWIVYQTGKNTHYGAEVHHVVVVATVDGEPGGHRVRYILPNGDIREVPAWRVVSAEAAMRQLHVLTGPAKGASSITTLPAKAPNAPAWRTEILRRRKELGLSRKEYADRLGYTDVAVSSIETGKHGEPRRETVIRYSEALGLDVAEMLALAGFAS